MSSEDRTRPATLRNIVAEAPIPGGRTFVGRHLTYPAGQPARSLEGGLRTAGRFKARAAPGGMPLVSVITVCLNSARTIEQCFKSVFQQTYANIEYIVIDGGSTDGTLDLIRKYEHALDYCVSEPDGGLYQAMNKGLSLATGDFILILNSDDWYRRDCVESLVRARTYSAADIVCALALNVDAAGDGGQVTRHLPYDQSIRMRMPLRHETMLIAAGIHDRVGQYDDSYRIIADFEFTIRLFDAGCSVYELPRPLMYFRNSGVSSTNLNGLFGERRRLFRAQYAFLSDEEAYGFGELAKLEPGYLTKLTDKYREHATFVSAMASYCEGRSSAGRQAQRWREAAAGIRALEGRRSPLISVILPVCNAQATLRECIGSVLAQTLGDFELLCINDASLDASQAIIDSHRASDPRVVCLANDVALGPGASRNRGVRSARGQYIFQMHTGDTIPESALELLYSSARESASDLVTGACLRLGRAPIVNTSLAATPDLLRAVEDRGSFLYDADLARRATYPSDLAVGQDDIFAVNLLVQAKRISVIDHVVCNRPADPPSAMAAHSFRWYADALEWRRRAWHLLKDAGLQASGDHLLQAHWEDAFFCGLAAAASPAQLEEFLEKFRQAFSEAGAAPAGVKASGFLKTLFSLILGRRDDEARELMIARGSGGASRAERDKISVATFCSMDYGGAGTGTQRRVAALRRHGIDARIYSLIVRSKHEYVRRLVPEFADSDVSQQMKVWEEVRLRAIKPVTQIPGYRAGELFSLTDSVLDFRKLSRIFDEFDVIHLHWVVGMLDYENMGEALSGKPVVWTLADMNAFTGGCHYSEGCDGYKRECRQCPLLGGNSDVAHEAWKIKKKAYAQLRNLHVVCPSQWLAERVRESSLLGDREIHYIPNAFPLESLALTAKVVARIRLGLPLNKKLLLFGADSLSNRRKGGDLLRAAIARFCSNGRRDDVEIAMFGSESIDMPLRVHRLGYISEEQKLSLAYSAADVFLCPSREDNGPLTVGEAMLCGTPVVSFPVGIVPVLVEHKINGYIAKYLDVGDFAEGIEWALAATPAEALARSAQCRIRASAFHDPKVAAARHEALYRQALNGPA